MDEIVKTAEKIIEDLEEGFTKRLRTMLRTIANPGEASTKNIKYSLKICHQLAEQIAKEDY